MTEAVWTGVGAGVAVMAAYVALRAWMHRMARRADETSRALRLTVGGMVVRMLAVLALATVVLAAAPVHDAAFGATLAAGLVLSSVAELIHGARASDASPKGASEDSPNAIS
jgi:hypothetical protein